MKKPLLAVLTLAVLSLGYGCKKKDPPPANQANVMFVNGCAGTLPGIDAKVNAANVDGALNMPFRTWSGYRYVKGGVPVELSFYITNVGTPISKGSATLTINTHYTAFCGGLITAPTFLLTQDTLIPPGQGMAKIRFVNLSNDNLQVDATAGTTVIGKAVKSLQVTSFIEIPSGNVELKAGDPSDISTVVATEPTAQLLASGKIYTMILTGTTAGTNDSKLKLKVVNNN